MSFWQELWEVLKPIVTTLITAGATYLVGCAGRWLGNKVAEIKESIKNETAKKVVKYVEQVAKDVFSEDKFNLAANRLSDLLGKKGIKVDAQEIEVLIENAVNEFNAAGDFKHEDSGENAKEETPAEDSDEESHTSADDFDIRDNIIRDICAEALKWPGYKGHKSEDSLIEFDKNVGGRYNYFARWLMDNNYFSIYVQNQSWCCLGVSYCFASVLGVAKAKALIGGRYAVTYVMNDCIARGGHIVTDAQPGDLEIQGKDDHITLVVGRDGNYVETVSFNSESSVWYGEVKRLNHIVNHPGVKCYVRPDWSKLCS